MKHIALMTIAILYLIFNVIQLDTIHDNDKINNKKALEILVGESGADFVNSVASNSILNNYQQNIYWHIRRLVIDHDDTDDLVQETFVKVWKNLAKFRSDSQLYTWIYRIATNESITFLNKKKLKNNAS